MGNESSLMIMWGMTQVALHPFILMFLYQLIKTLWTVMPGCKPELHFLLWKDLNQIHFQTRRTPGFMLPEGCRYELSCVWQGCKEKDKDKEQRYFALKEICCPSALWKDKKGKCYTLMKDNAAFKYSSEFFLPKNTWRFYLFIILQLKVQVWFICDM